MEEPYCNVTEKQEHFWSVVISQRVLICGQMRYDIKAITVVILCPQDGAKFLPISIFDYITEILNCTADDTYSLHSCEHQTI